MSDEQRAVRRYENHGDLLPDGRTFVLASDYDKLKAERDELRAHIAEYIGMEETAIEEWNREYPRLAWKDDHPAMERLRKARALLSRTTP